MKSSFRQCFLALVTLHLLIVSSVSAEVIHILYVSDMHYGIEKEFRGESNVSAQRVNQSMIERINTLPNMRLSKMKGAVASGQKIGSIDAVFNTGDITNRMQNNAICAKESWAQFHSDWSTLLTLRTESGESVPQYLSAGNHEASNAVGMHKLIMPTDPSVMVELYNRALSPAEKLTNETFDFQRDRVHYTVDIGGVKCIFIALWLDSKEIEWVSSEIERLGGDEPILLFSHDAPRGVTKHFVNPNGDHSTNAVDQFENILSDTCSVNTIKGEPVAEQMALSRFIRSQPRIKGYFHGDDNYSEFYTYVDPEGNDVIPTFRVDSPMKGRRSAKDESLLSFMVISIDTKRMVLTARECFWNRGRELEWGECKSIAL